MYPYCRAIINTVKPSHRYIKFALILFLTATLFPLPNTSAANNPVLFITPNQGSFAVGSTFAVNVAINTKGENVNAFKIKLFFPAERLQIVSSGTGQSIAGVWVRRPTYSNEAGTLELEGAIPSPGVNTDQGIITTITFRVRAIGVASNTAVRFDRSSTVYLNDGSGTELSPVFVDGFYSLVLPPPEGPLVISPTHPDQEKWYALNDTVLRWDGAEGYDDYSFLLSGNPLDLPDNTPDGPGTSTVYKGLADGRHYFHIKALRDGIWGGVTHYGIKTQTGGPADFNIEVLPRSRTSSPNIIFTFETTDRYSGFDHYEAKIIPLNKPLLEGNSDEALFFEVKSPYVFTPTEHGSYQFIVRAFNKVGNITESSVKVTSVAPFFQFLSVDGIHLGKKTIPWYIFWPIIAVLMVALFYVARHVFRWHVRIDFVHQNGAVYLEEQHSVIKSLRERLGFSKVIAAILIPLSLLSGSMSASAATLSPPSITSFSENLNNDEIFYVGGRTVTGEEGVVVLFVQSLTSGEIHSYEVPIKQNGDWFYTSNTFLDSGNYILWTQLKLGDVTSPPSSQVQMVISSKAIQIGASRLSYEMLYLILMLLFAVISIGLGVFSYYHWRYGSRKYSSLQKEVREAQDAVRTGFITLHQDINHELQSVHTLRTSQQISPQDEEREKLLLQHLEEVNSHIEREVWDITRAMGSRMS